MMLDIRQVLVYTIVVNKAEHCVLTVRHGLNGKYVLSLVSLENKYVL
jgi:hypothetical protein